MTTTLTSSPSTFQKQGDVLTLTATVQNTGTDTLGNVAVVIDGVTLSCTPTTPVAFLTPGNSVVCRGSYVVTEADADASVVRKKATASAIAYTSGAPLLASGSVSVTGPPPPTRLALRVVMASNPDSFKRAGQKLDLTALITNTGNVTAKNVVITGSVPGLVCTPQSPVVSLAAKATIRCTGSYIVTQADITAGTLRALTRATAVSDAGTRVAATGTVEVKKVIDPDRTALRVPLTVTPQSFSSAGQTITVKAVVTNTGVVPLINVDVASTPISLICTPRTPVAKLDVDAKVSCTGTYVTTRADVQAGVVTFTVKATGSSAGGATAVSERTRRARLALS